MLSYTSPLGRPITDTRANLLAMTPALPVIALASDTLEPMVWDGSAWYVAPFRANRQTTLDIGLTGPMVTNQRLGYGDDYIITKTLYDAIIGSGGTATTGAIRISSGVFQVYLNGAWNDINVGFRFRENSTGGYALEHNPVGFSLWIEIDSGNSQNDLGLNGLPLVQGYQMSMGAYPVNQQITSRTITS